MSVLQEQYSDTGTAPGVSQVDWTEYHDRNSVAKYSNMLIDELILEIHSKTLPIHQRIHLNPKELALLYRWPIHVGTNIFIERLLRIVLQKDLHIVQAYPQTQFNPVYCDSTVQAVQRCYYDFNINYNLLNEISCILDSAQVPNNMAAVRLPGPQDGMVCDKSFGVRTIIKEGLKTLISSYVRINKPEIVGEYSNWMREILPLKNLLWFDFGNDRYKTDTETRNWIKECSKEVFCRYVLYVLAAIDQQQKIKLSELFADFIDRILPISIVEGLNDRFEYYGKMIEGWDIKQVQSFTGYYYNENFKIFSIVAKRKDARLVGYQHGASCPVALYKNVCNELAFLDYYIARGKNDCEWMKGEREFEKLDIISLGSPYYATIKKWDKTEIDPERLLMLYPSGPLMDFMSDLEEITPEKNFRDRINVLNLLNRIWDSYPNLKLLYKPFPGTYTNDPINKMCAKHFRDGRIELINEYPRNLYHKADIVLWDSISTGFSESIASGVPTLVFQSQYEYDKALPIGKELCNKLMKSGMVFYDVESGFESFKNIINNVGEFKKSRFHAVREFQEAVCYPVSKKEFRKNLKSVVARVNGAN